MDDVAFARWIAGLEARHMADLTFPEVRRAVQALSSLYVERRGRIAAGSAIATRGKHAAFALYFAPIHHLLVRAVVRGLGAAEPPPRRVVDLGCGTGAAGCAWALETRGGSEVRGLDVNGWALDEARLTFAALGVKGSTQRADIARFARPGPRDAVLAAFAVNELDAATREALLGRLLDAARGGARVLVVEPIARRAAPWWAVWSRAFVAAGGRDDDWRVPAELPEILARLDRAAGLDHRELTGRSLWLAPR